MTEPYDIAPLVEAAKKATQGEWRLGVASMNYLSSDHGGIATTWGKLSEHNGAFIVLVQPKRILELTASITAERAAHAADRERLAEVEREKRELAEWVLRYSAAKQHLNHPTQAETMRSMMDDAERFMVDIARAALGDRRDG